MIAACNAETPADDDGRFNANLFEGMADAGAVADPRNPNAPPSQPSGVPTEQAAAGSGPSQAVPGQGIEFTPPDADESDAPAQTEGETEPSTPLRDTAPGEVAVLDPSVVYIVGNTAEIAEYSVLGIAPLEAPSDSIAALDWFSKAWIRQSDGHLIYQDQNYGNPARELRRDAPPIPNLYGIHDGETVFPSDLPCNPGEAQQNTQRRYMLGWDGTLYHTCGNDDPGALPDDPNHLTWYTPEGDLAYRGDIWFARVGPQKRALGQHDGTFDLVVVDFTTGDEIAAIPLDGKVVVASRMHAQGFMVALRDDGDGRYWLDLDLNGAVISEGTYAPLPEGAWYVGDGNAFGLRVGVIDPQGRLYEYAGNYANDSPTVIRRPRTGTSDIPYSASSTPDLAPGDTFLQASLPMLITGG